MTYNNPKPTVFDGEMNSVTRQEKSVAEYTSMKNVYFAFVDILGFKQTFDENRKNPDDEFAIAFKDSFQYFSLLMNSARFSKGDRHWNAGQTSDSLYFYTDRIDYLAAFIKIYSHFSLYAMSKDVFLRGGIAKGNLYIDKPHQFYGDSVIKAYLLESNIAKRPLIVIDQNTFDDLEIDGEALDFLVGKSPPERSYIKPFMEISEGELQAYINVSIEELHEITADLWVNIKENIKKNLERFEFDEKNYQKYAFLQQQQNDFENNLDGK